MHGAGHITLPTLEAGVAPALLELTRVVAQSNEIADVQLHIDTMDLYQELACHHLDKVDDQVYNQSVLHPVSAECRPPHGQLYYGPRRCPVWRDWYKGDLLSVENWS